MKKTIVFGLLTALWSGAALAAEIKPAIVYGTGGKFDKSFNEMAHSGAERFSKETGIAYRDFELANDTQSEQALRRFAQQGYEPIIGVGFTHASAMEKVAPEFPDVSFAIIDGVVDQPNVTAVLFREHEGSFLVGMLAAMASESGKIGFVGGMDIPLIRAFQCGYTRGANFVDEEVEVLANMTGTTFTAWTDPVRGAELAKAQIAQGADVVYQAAGGTGIGVLQATADEGKLGIGVDSNQNYLHPNHMLTSMIKKVDQAVYDVWTAAQNDELKSGIIVLGLAEGGVDWADDSYNATLISDAMRDKVTEAKTAIIDGSLVVHDYRANGQCDG